jgi:hypothetical protein
MDLHPLGGPVRSIKEQRGTLIQELRRYDGALVVIEFSGRGPPRSCDAALK